MERKRVEEESTQNKMQLTTLEIYCSFHRMNTQKIGFRVISDANKGRSNEEDIEQAVNFGEALKRNFLQRAELYNQIFIPCKLLGFLKRESKNSDGVGLDGRNYR